MKKVMDQKTRNEEYTSSLKSLETENVVDRAFYRPVGFVIARSLRNTGITPNMITILSIFVGVMGGYMFYHPGIWWAVGGILFLVAANILDCTDGQLARMTGIKSPIGRILDGLAGDLWFLSIYLGLSLRLYQQYDNPWIFGVAVLSALSHLLQANITDYYKTLHLFFINKEKGKEFETTAQIKQDYAAMKPGVNKFFFFFYLRYTMLQEAVTPKLQQMLASLKAQYGDDIPEDIRLSFREKSKKLMHRWIDFLTFNGRTIFLFIIVLTGMVWLYFVFEIIILNTILFISVRKHEKMCASFC